MRHLFLQPALNCVHVIINFYKSDNVLPHAQQCLKVSSKSVQACQRYDGKSSHKCPECERFSMKFDLKHIV